MLPTMFLLYVPCTVYLVGDRLEWTYTRGKSAFAVFEAPEIAAAFEAVS